MEKIFAALEKFASFIFGIDNEAGNWISMIIDFAKDLLGLKEEPEEPQLPR